MKRKYMCSDYSVADLRMITPHIFAIAQKISRVKRLLDNNYDSFWKTIEVLALESFHPDTDILWKSFAPESILLKLGNTQLADAIRTWYIYRDKAVFNTWDIEF